MKRYAIVVEDAGPNLAAYVPDLPGCVATGESVAEVEVANVRLGEDRHDCDACNRSGHEGRHLAHGDRMDSSH